MPYGPLSQNRQAAEIVGVNVAKVYSITLAVSAALAGACGSLISMVQSFTPFEGGFFIMKAFIICVLGGLGNVLGAIIGGLILGIVETMGARILGNRFSGSDQRHHHDSGPHLYAKGNCGIEIQVKIIQGVNVNYQCQSESEE